MAFIGDSSRPWNTCAVVSASHLLRNFEHEQASLWPSVAIAITAFERSYLQYSYYFGDLLHIGMGDFVERCGTSDERSLGGERQRCRVFFKLPSDLLSLVLAAV